MLERKTVVVSWSGGFDSTALLLHYIDEGYDIHTVEVQLLNNVLQSAAETAARNNIFSILLNKYEAKISRCGPSKILIDRPIGRCGLIQPSLWATICCSCLPYAGLPIDIAFGYVKGDDVWHYRTEFINVCKNVGAMMDADVNVVFPFEWDAKDDIVKLYHKYPGLIEYVSTTEDGRDWRLGNCNKSREMRRLYQIYKHNRSKIKGPDTKEIDVIEEPDA